MLKIQTTGLDQYSAGGAGKVKTLVIGGPGVGKTRWSSYFPKPIYLDCESGLASVADRKVQFASIRSSQDMLEALVYLKQECMRPAQDRTFGTVVVDTLDAFQRKVKDEWLQAHPGETAFRGFDAWGYLDAKMQMLATRLLNLDMNVIVAVHYQEKTIREGSGDNATERQEFALQLSGTIKDSIFNDFDLVGWMGTYYELDSSKGERVQKRGLTFKPTPDKPFLKDRLHVTPPWMEVTFSDADYAKLFEAVASRLDEMGETEEFGEIPDATASDFRNAQPGSVGGIVPPLGGGALPPQDPRDIPLVQFDKPTLQKMARELGLEFKGNTLKGELVEMIEAKRAEPAAAPAVEAKPDPVADAPEASAPAEQPVAPAAATDDPWTAGPDDTDAQVASAPEVQPEQGTDVPDPAPEPSPEVAPDDSAHVEAASAALERAKAAQSAKASLTANAAVAGAALVHTERGAVDTTTGEVVADPPTEPEAIETIENVLGGQVTSVLATAEVPVETPEAPTATDTTCEEEGCGNAQGPNPDFLKLSYIKYRKHLCDDHYLARKKAS